MLFTEATKPTLCVYPREICLEREDNRIFVGGLSRDVTERQLENAFSSYGKITECQVMLERDTGRPRGFGFITFLDHRSMDDAVREMHGREFGDHAISVNKAQPKMSGGNLDHGYKDGRGGYGGDRPLGQDECLKCGNRRHWARDSPSAGGHDGGRYGDRDCFDDRDKYGSHDRYAGDRYPPSGECVASDRYGVSDRYAPNGYWQRQRH